MGTRGGDRMYNALIVFSARLDAALWL
ncbi:hypothetical protein BURKHO8Y_560001 [Burkholderia sp. 8Y]|nr:hypothetical protein BURKHO8Y_560001 [Burkholderia sp. 8Y]